MSFQPKPRTWYMNCQVHNVACNALPGSGAQIAMLLSSPDFPGESVWNQWDAASEQSANYMMQVALTALSTGKKVCVYSSDKTAVNQFTNIFVVA